MNTYYVTTLVQYTYTVRAEDETSAEEMEDVIETAYDNLHEIMGVELKEEDVDGEEEGDECVGCGQILESEADKAAGKCADCVTIDEEEGEEVQHR